MGWYRLFELVIHCDADGCFERDRFVGAFEPSLLGLAMRDGWQIDEMANRCLCPTCAKKAIPVVATTS